MLHCIWILLIVGLTQETLGKPIFFPIVIDGIHKRLHPHPVPHIAPLVAAATGSLLLGAWRDGLENRKKEQQDHRQSLFDQQLFQKNLQELQNYQQLNQVYQNPFLNGVPQYPDDGLAQYENFLRQYQHYLQQYLNVPPRNQFEQQEFLNFLQKYLNFLREYDAYRVPIQFSQQNYLINQQHYLNRLQAELSSPIKVPVSPFTIVNLLTSPSANLVTPPPPTKKGSYNEFDVGVKPPPWAEHYRVVYPLPTGRVKIVDEQEDRAQGNSDVLVKDHTQLIVTKKILKEKNEEETSDLAGLKQE